MIYSIAKSCELKEMLQQIVYYAFGLFQLTATETNIVAILSKDVILPCRFGSAQLPEIVLHWMYKTPKNLTIVHSFYRKKEQLNNQSQRYRRRTNLFLNEIMNGNASLQLTEINIADEGVYQCYVSTRDGKIERDIFLQVAGDSKNMTLDPPNMLDAETNIICTITGAYPKPSVKWQKENGADLTDITASNTTETIDPKGLYNVQSILQIDHTSNTTYRCNIRNERLQKSWGASWKMQGILKENEKNGIEINCNYSTNNHQNLTIIWKVRKSKISPLAEICKSVPQSGDKNSNCKNDQFKMINSQNSSSLTLHQVSKEDAGEYTCEISMEDALQIFSYVLQLDQSVQEEVQKYSHYGLIPAALFVLCVIISVLVFLFFIKKQSN